MHVSGWGRSVMLGAHQAAGTSYALDFRGGQAIVLRLQLLALASDSRSSRRCVCSSTSPPSSVCLSAGHLSASACAWGESSRAPKSSSTVPRPTKLDARVRPSQLLSLCAQLHGFVFIARIVRSMARRDGIGNSSQGSPQLPNIG